MTAGNQQIPAIFLFNEIWSAIMEEEASLKYIYI